MMISILSFRAERSKDPEFMSVTGNPPLAQGQVWIPVRGNDNRNEDNHLSGATTQPFAV